MKAKTLLPRLAVPATVTYISGKKHIKLQIANTRLEDWVDKQVILESFNLTDRTLRTLRSCKKFPLANSAAKYTIICPVCSIFLSKVQRYKTFQCAGSCPHET